MSEIGAALLAGLTCVTALALLGIAPFRDEFRSLPRQLLALALWTAVLALVVFLPVVSASAGEPMDPAHVGFGWLFVGHALLAAFLLSWWRLRGDIGLAEFFALRRSVSWRSYVFLGLVGGAVAWVATVAVTGLLAGAWVKVQELPPTAEIPPVIFWMAELPAWKKLVIVLVAMVVEEAFFRAFLQRRLGLWLSSALFAVSHFSYGLPFLVVGVFIVSLFFGWLFARTGSLIPPMLAHGLFNGVQLFLILPAMVEWFGGGKG